jgi:hypothetical protein
LPGITSLAAFVASALQASSLFNAFPRLEVPTSPCENNHMFTRSSPAWGASSPSIAWAALQTMAWRHHQKHLGLSRGCGLGDSIALNGACADGHHAGPGQPPVHHRHFQSLDKTCGLTETGIINLEKTAPLTGLAAIVPAMWTALATSLISPRRSCASARAVAGQSTWPTKAPSPSTA